MRIEVFKLFLDVVRFSSFSEAAEENNMAQSTVSQAINQLEKEFNAVLIDRSQRPWKLTPQGEVFSNGCRNIIKHYNDLKKKVEDYPDSISSVVRVGSIYSTGLRHMNMYVKKYKELYPGVQIELEFLHPDRVVEKIRHGELDIGIISFPKAVRDMNVISWHEELMVLACNPEHPFKTDDEMDLEEIANEKFIAFNRELNIRKEINYFIKEAGITVNVVLEFDNIEAIKRAVEAGYGVSILPRPTFEAEIRRGSLHAVHFKNRDFVRPLGILSQRSSKLDENVMQFVEFLRMGKSKPKQT
jgi:DNA-binding transcriptional LysR family regulator